MLFSDPWKITEDLVTNSDPQLFCRLSGLNLNKMYVVQRVKLIFKTVTITWTSLLVTFCPIRAKRVMGNNRRWRGVEVGVRDNKSEQLRAAQSVCDWPPPPECAVCPPTEGEGGGRKLECLLWILCVFDWSVKLWPTELQFREVFSEMWNDKSWNDCLGPIN